MSELDTMLEELLIDLQNKALELNEYKEENYLIHVEYYMDALTVAIDMTRNYQTLRNMDNLFFSRLGKSLGIPYYE